MCQNTMNVTNRLYFFFIKTAPLIVFLKQYYSTYLIKSAMKMQPIKDIAEADRTTTITLPAALTRPPSPAPTMI